MSVKTGIYKHMHNGIEIWTQPPGNPGTWEQSDGQAAAWTKRQSQSTAPLTRTTPGIGHRTAEKSHLSTHSVRKNMQPWSTYFFKTTDNCAVLNVTLNNWQTQGNQSNPNERKAYILSN